MLFRYLVPGWRLGWIVIHDRHEAFKQEVSDWMRLIRLLKRMLPKLYWRMCKSCVTYWLTFCDWFASDSIWSGEPFPANPWTEYTRARSPQYNPHTDAPRIRQFICWCRSGEKILLMIIRNHFEDMKRLYSIMVLRIDFKLRLFQNEPLQ